MKLIREVNENVGFITEATETGQKQYFIEGIFMHGDMKNRNGRVSHMITNLRQEGSNFVGKAKIMDTPMGKVGKNLMDEGATLGVSSRGMGSLKPNKLGIMEVQEDFMLATAGDIVADPSAPNAFVRGIMEGVEWVYDVASGSWRSANTFDQIHEETKHMNSKQLEENAARIFSKFMKSLSE